MDTALIASGLRWATFVLLLVSLYVIYTSTNRISDVVSSTKMCLKTEKIIVATFPNLTQLDHRGMPSQLAMTPMFVELEVCSVWK